MMVRPLYVIFCALGFNGGSSGRVNCDGSGTSTATVAMGGPPFDGDDSHDAMAMAATTQ
jgi:hypothetical protein